MYGSLNRNISERSLTTRCQKFHFHKIQVVNFTLDITTGVTHCKIIQLIPSYREFSTCWVFSLIFSITDHLSSSFVVRSICASRLHLSFLNGPGRTATCSLYIYTASQYRKVYIFLRRDIGRQTITFLATNNYNPIFHHFFKKDKLGLEKPTSLSLK